VNRQCKDFTEREDIPEICRQSLRLALIIIVGLALAVGVQFVEWLRSLP